MEQKIGPYSIALVSDFFCPNAGGVETHIYFLAQCLINLGHRVVVVTHGYGDRKGVRYLSNGLKVYYLPFIVAYNGATLSSIIGSMPWLRKVFLRENVQIIHGHSYSLINVDQIICVSYTSKENTVLRGKLDPNKVSTIPNAIETSLFTPDTDQFFKNPTTIIFLGRLVYRKGADLLCEIVPKVCARHKTVRFIIGGDGPKRIELEEMREKYNLHSRVVMLGMLPHNQVKQVLNQGQIFINTSLTEAFCMSIVEAASCGLHVVSTRVGGVPEVLPIDEFISLEEPVPDDLVEALLKAVEKREKGKLMDPYKKHEAVSKMYNWPDVAERTQVIYQKAVETGSPGRLDRLKGYYDQGIGFGILYIVVACIIIFWLKILDIFDPPAKNRLKEKPKSQ
ncbi:Protein CBG00513 [Caenorhabditis briggsae]|uniref:Protein CBG00513 n=1 Tax=Caenorhabditis briggsae TaxID=6238 RepID=A8WNQ6_CAEBR|nr:Protein CBG00513 [Caenorhabditis briggsae]CAP22111.2 Protein CBG00513 [Caenorhabditis briggsae]